MNLYHITNIQGREALLEGEEAKHCMKVLRKKRGDEIYGIDGKGMYHGGRILDLGKGWVKLGLVEQIKEWGEHAYKIEIAISPLRLADRMEWVVEKSVELGATHITPVITRRTVKAKLRLSRLERIMVAAMKQCMRSRLPILSEPIEFSTFLDQAEGLKLMGSGAAPAHLIHQAEAIKASNTITILVGPEGDFTDEEVEAAKATGFETVQLGKNRLRSETAAIDMLAAVKLFKEY